MLGIVFLFAAVTGWHDVIGEATLADAIPDRIVHNSHRIVLTGESLRKRKKLNETEEVDVEE